MKPIYAPAVQPIADYVAELERDGKIDHAVAFDIRLKLASIVASPAEPQTLPALEMAIGCLQSIADMKENEPREPDDADWRWRALECKRCATVTLAAIAAPPAQCSEETASALDCQEYMPLTLKPLDNPNHDPGEHWVLDAGTAYLFRIEGNRKRAERIVATLNAAYLVSRPLRETPK